MSHALCALLHLLLTNNIIAVSFRLNILMVVSDTCAAMTMSRRLERLHVLGVSDSRLHRCDEGAVTKHCLEAPVAQLTDSEVAGGALVATKAPLLHEVQRHARCLSHAFAQCLVKSE